MVTPYIDLGSVYVIMKDKPIEFSCTQVTRATGQCTSLLTQQVGSRRWPLLTQERTLRPVEYWLENWYVCHKLCTSTRDDLYPFAPWVCVTTITKSPI